MLVITTLSLAASGYVINDYFDLKIDRINRPDKIVVGEVFPRRTVLLWHVVFTLIGVFFGLYLAYVLRKENYALMFIIIPALLWYYSTTLKKQFLVGNLTISFLTALVAYFVVSVEFAALAKVQGPDVLQSPACSMAWFWTSGFAFFAFISTLAREIIKDMEDLEGDSAMGCSTLPIEMGITMSGWVVVAINILSIAVLWGVYFMVPTLRESRVVLFYFLFLLSLPYLILSLGVLKATNKSAFHRMSQMSKIIMLIGILFIFVAQSFFV
jgi:4-hydroxybenzoate polyprenyltransferase